ncbi:MAG TPA: arginine--tRNA ligase [Deltaproteobacteria bacterium]|nr:arginine--tRNA ligase [Deltaproteobacteria bacterium]HPR53777.1 arginine--tRNA ligase [Deltaproteobacteria bacterium]HXK46794.1 arginine--tRNA ligase [Deltaproteobacteria bacterium]
MKDKVERLLKDTLTSLMEAGTLPAIDIENISVSIPPNKEFGDFATNVAMVSAKKAKKPPREVAATVVQALASHGEFLSRAEVAGPGFINLFLNPVMWAKALREIVVQGKDFGRTSYGAGKKVQVEFVSANPTGPLHIGHGRGAAVGDTLVRILDAAGFEVQAEYYINDIGNQMNNLGLSVLHRYREIHGRDEPFPESGYKGDYIRDIARELISIHGAGLLSKDDDEAVQICREYAAGTILAGIREDLSLFNVHFDRWFSESSLYLDHKVQASLDYLKARGLSYEEDGALWFRTSSFGDEKDRVLRKQDGSLTYFAPDIAYHKDKLDRGFEKVIDIWGADHHGYVPRMNAAIAAMGADKDCFHALLIQLVSLVRDGRPVQMSTRAGEFVTLREIVEEVGKDVARFFFMMRKCDAQLVFDLDLAKKKSEENPVYYIQYAHARICSILKNAAEQGIVASHEDADLQLLASGDDLDLIKILASCPDMVASSAADLEPHRIAFYLLDVATAFHRFYNRNRVISDDAALTRARLILVGAVRQVIANTLALMGVDAPESM